MRAMLRMDLLQLKTANAAVAGKRRWLSSAIGGLRWKASIIMRRTRYPAGDRRLIGCAAGGASAISSRLAAKGGSEFVDLTSPAVRRHILDGEVRPNGTYGGGHRAGTGFPNESEFPASWSDDKIIHEIPDVSTDPAAQRLASRAERPSFGEHETASTSRSSCATARSERATQQTSGAIHECAGGLSPAPAACPDAG